MRVLITGARGQVGQSLRERIPEDWEVIFTDSKTLDITNSTTVDAMIQGFQPEIIINTAAYTNVDQAEHEPQRAFSVNANGVANLALAANKVGSRLIHLSTDHVFNGLNESPLHELHPTDPINNYGRSKLAGELLGLSILKSCIIVRTSWVYGEFGNNFVKSILNLGLNKKELNIINDQICRPTYSGDLADAIIQIALISDIAAGIYHFCSESAISRVNFVQRIINIAQMKDTRYKNVSINIVNEFPNAASRPYYSVLCTNKITSLLKQQSGTCLTTLEQVILDKLIF